MRIIRSATSTKPPPLAAENGEKRLVQSRAVNNRETRDSKATRHFVLTFPGDSPGAGEGTALPETEKAPRGARRTTRPEPITGSAFREAGVRMSRRRAENSRNPLREGLVPTGAGPRSAVGCDRGPWSVPVSKGPAASSGSHRGVLTPPTVSPGPEPEAATWGSQSQQRKTGTPCSSSFQTTSLSGAPPMPKASRLGTERGHRIQTAAASGQTDRDRDRGTDRGAHSGEGVVSMTTSSVISDLFCV